MNERAPAAIEENQVNQTFAEVGSEIAATHPADTGDEFSLGTVGAGAGQAPGPEAGPGWNQGGGLADRAILAAAVKVLDNLSQLPLKRIAGRIRTPEQVRELMETLRATQQEIDAIVEPGLLVCQQFGLDLRRLPLVALAIGLANVAAPKIIAYHDLAAEVGAKFPSSPQPIKPAADGKP